MALYPFNDPLPEYKPARPDPRDYPLPPDPPDWLKPYLPPSPPPIQLDPPYDPPPPFWQPVPPDNRTDGGAPFAANHPAPLRALDPLVVDLNGNGVNLTNVQDSAAYFDYGGTGFAAHTGWITPTEGILINDIHPDTNAVTADELLGAYSGDGFADLAALDSNGDGKIDANDAAFASLRVWRDANGNGVGDTGELITLAVAGITAINLNAQSARQNINGNVVTGTSTFVRADGTTATIAEVQFSTDSLYTQFTPPPGF